jgi:hypothetical protein
MTTTAPMLHNSTEVIAARSIDVTPGEQPERNRARQMTSTQPRTGRTALGLLERRWPRPVGRIAPSGSAWEGTLVWARCK